MEALSNHPSIETGWEHNQSELNFFNFNYVKGYSWYHTQFEFDRNVSGEFSVQYWTHPEVPSRIKQYNEDIQLILSLRHPVQRAFSQHKHEIRRKRIPESLYDFEKAIRQNPSYKSQGRYATYLEQYLEEFHFDKIHVILVDDIREHPKQVVSNLYSFLGVDAEHQPEFLNEKVHEAYQNKIHGLGTLINKTSDVVRKVFGNKIRSLIQKTGLSRRIRKWNREPFDEDDIPIPDKQFLKQLTEEFCDEINRLEEITGRDLSAWKKPPDINP